MTDPIDYSTIKPCSKEHPREPRYLGIQNVDAKKCLLQDVEDAFEILAEEEAD